MLRVRLLVVAAALLLLSACQADVGIDIDVAADGSGDVTVELVADAAIDDAVGGLATQLRVDDLRGAGWQIETVLADGDTRITATKSVGAPDQWQQVLDEIAGPGVFIDVQLVADSEFATARQRLTFSLDLSDGWDLFADTPIDTLTGGQPIDEIVSVSVSVAVASDDDNAPSSKTYTPRFDDGAPVPVALQSITENSTAVLFRWITLALFSLSVLAALLAVTGIVLQRRSDRLRPNPTPASLATRVPGATTPGATRRHATAPGAVRPPSARNDSVRLVVIDPLSVLYQQSRVLDSSLLPFVREHHGSARADTIVEGYRALVAGSSDTATFWELCGVEGSPSALDDAYVATRSLRPGAADFLAEMQDRRIPVAATTNDALSWSEKARDRDRLSAVWPWLISSVVGTTTATGAMFEVLRRESGVAHGHCLYVHSDVASLDAAKELGMKTVLFDTGDLDLPEIVDHPVVNDLGEIRGPNKS